MRRRKSEWLWMAQRRLASLYRFREETRKLLATETQRDFGDQQPYLIGYLEGRLETEKRECWYAWLNCHVIRSVIGARQ